MTRKNKGICHSCRRPGHNLSRCPTKQHCPSCGQGFVKWMEVEKNTVNKGRMFFCCSVECGYFKWGDECPQKKPDTFGEQASGGVYDEGESSGVVLAKSSATKEMKQDMAQVFKLLARIFEEEDVEISLNLTIHKGKGNACS